MALRVTQGATNRAYLKNLNTSQLNMNRSMEKLQTGRKFSRVSDDVRSATKCIDIRSKLYRNTQVQDNVSMSIDELAVGESVLSEISSICSGVLGEIKKAENDPSRFGAESTYIDELEQAKQEILRLSNKQYNDKFLLGGLGVDTEPFTVDKDGRLMFNGVRLCDVSDVNDGDNSYNKCVICRDEINRWDEEDQDEYTYDMVDTEEEKAKLKRIFDSHNGTKLQDKIYDLKKKSLENDTGLKDKAATEAREEIERDNIEDAVRKDTAFIESLKSDYVANNYDKLMSEYTSIKDFYTDGEINGSQKTDIQNRLRDAIKSDSEFDQIKTDYVKNNYDTLLNTHSDLKNFYTDEEINDTQKADIQSRIKTACENDNKFDIEALKTEYVGENYDVLLDSYPDIKSAYTEEERNSTKKDDVINDLKTALENDGGFDEESLKSKYVDDEYDNLIVEYSDVKKLFTNEEINNTKKDDIVNKLKTACEKETDFEDKVLDDCVNNNYKDFVDKYSDIRKLYTDEEITNTEKPSFEDKLKTLCENDSDFKEYKETEINNTAKTEYSQFAIDRDAYAKYPNIKADENSEDYLKLKEEKFINLVDEELISWKKNPGSDYKTLENQAVEDLKDDSYSKNGEYWLYDSNKVYYLTTNLNSNDFRVSTDHSIGDHNKSVEKNYNASQEKYYIVNGKPIVLSHDNYIDVGLDMAKNTTAVSKFNVSVDGVKALGYGSAYSSDLQKDVSNNIYDLLTDMQEVLGRLKDYSDSNKNGDGSVAKPDVSELSALLKKFEVQSENVIASVAEVGVRSKYLETTMSRLENENSALESTKNYLEAVDDATEITMFKGYQNAWNLSLQFGGSIIPKSLMDYIR